MSTRQPTWPAVLDQALTSRLRGVHTAMLGQIEAYSEAAQTATVSLAVQLEATEDVYEIVPPLEDVPVAWPGAWAQGDTCLLVFCEEDFSLWFATSSVQPPEVLRRHGLHAVCIPLVARAGQAVQFVALANLVDARIATLRDAFNAHTHLTAGTGAPVAPTPLTGVGPGGPIATLASVAAAKVKAR